MKDKDLQKVGLMMCAIIFIVAPRLPVVGLCLILLWIGVLAFDSIENRKKTNMVMFDG